jgi:hypothetical protein
LRKANKEQYETADLTPMPTLFRTVVFMLLSFRALAQPAHDNFANRIPVQPSVSFIGSVTGATLEPFDPLHPLAIYAGSNRTNGSVWWSWTPDTTGFAAIVETRNNFPCCGFHTLAVYNGNDLATLRDPVWMFVGPIYGRSINGPEAFLGFLTTADLPVSIGMVGEATESLYHEFLISVSDTPILNESPASQTNVAGGAVYFRFTSPSYRFGRTQWQFNSQDIPNATNAVLFLSDLRPSQAGEYRVIIEATNSAGVLKRTISNPATLTVIGDISRPTIAITPNSSNNLTLAITAPESLWYSVDRTADFKTWSRVANPGDGNVANSQNPLLIQNAFGAGQFFRVEHRGNLPEVCIQNLRAIHFAKEQLRIPYHHLPGQLFNPANLKEFLGELPICPQGGTYDYGPFDTAPHCDIRGHDPSAGVVLP